MARSGQFLLKNRGAVGAAAIISALLSPAVASACVISIEPAQDELILAHNPLESDVAQGIIEVAIVNRGEIECAGTIGASLLGERYGLRAAADARPIFYRLVDEKAGADITPQGGRYLARSGGYAIRLGPGERSLELVSFTAATDGMVSEGRYTQFLNLELTSREGVPLGARPVTVGVEIIPAAQIGLKGAVTRSRGSGSVDLGELEPGVKDLPVSLYVVTTGGYRVSISSENQGRLKHQSAQWFIDYRMQVGRYDLDLTREAAFEISSDRARMDDYPVRIEIGQTGAKRAGAYLDRVTFTVAPL